MPLQQTRWSELKTCTRPALIILLGYVPVDHDLHHSDLLGRSGDNDEHTFIYKVSIIDYCDDYQQNILL